MPAFVRRIGWVRSPNCIPGSADTSSTGPSKKGLLDQHGEPTEQGRHALRTGTVDEDTEWSVRYVFSDPVTGYLWPRAVERLCDVYVLKVAPDHIVADLGTAGHPNKVRALRMTAADARPKTPRPDQVLEVARRDRQARIDARTQVFARRYNLGPLADLDEEQATYGGRVAADEAVPELSRVTFIADPEPVEILGAIEVASGPADRAGAGWIPHDPFGVGTNAMFGDLVALWSAQHAELAEDLERLMEQQAATIRADYTAAAQRARAQEEAALVSEYGTRLRQDRGVLDKLVELRIASYESDRDAAVAAAKKAAFALFEELLFRLVIAYPMPRDLAEPLAQRAADRRRSSGERRSMLWAPEVAKELLRMAAAKIGAYDVPELLLKTTSDALGRLAGDSRPHEGTQAGVLLAACLLAADRRDDHPLRRLIAKRPELLFEIDNLRQLRNAQAHRLSEPSVSDDMQWCQELASLAAGELLELPTAR